MSSTGPDSEAMAAVAALFDGREPPAVAGPPDTDFLRRVARAIAADRAVRWQPELARPHADLAESLYTLLPERSTSVDLYLAANVRVIAEYLAFFERTEECRGTIPEAAALTSGVSHLAAQYGAFRDVDAVVAVAERVLAANRDVTGRYAVGFWAVANNLANLYLTLARDQPAAAEHRLGDALRCNELAAAAVDDADGDGDEIPRCRESSARQREVIAAAVERNHEPTSDQRAANQMIAVSVALNRLGQGPAVATDADLAAHYDELAAALERIIRASGFDWRLSKLILALGAIASGRRGELTADLVAEWLSSATAPPDEAAWTPQRARQLLGRDGDPDGPGDWGTAAAHVIVLARLAQELPSRAAVRAHNAELLEFLVTRPPIVQEYAEPAVTPQADLRALLEAGAWAFRSPFDGSTARKARRAAGR